MEGLIRKSSIECSYVDKCSVHRVLQLIEHIQNLLLLQVYVESEIRMAGLDLVRKLLETLILNDQREIEPFGVDREHCGAK
jgi:hypothetical protein